MSDNPFKKLLTTQLQKNNMTLSDSQIDQLARYLLLMQTWNRVFNLTTITDPHEMVMLHIIDSLSVQPYLTGKHFLDIGTGAGLPGIPLAITNPEQQWVLLDKNNKKTRFLTQVVAELGLTNVKVANGRGEDFHHDHCFDSILSRAFGTLSLFIETTEHVLCPHGTFIAMKGKYPEEELSALPERFKVQVVRLTIKGMDIERHAVLIKKTG